MTKITENWDFYLCRVDGKFASIFVDLGAVNEAPVKTHPVMAYVRLMIRNPREDGMPGNDEYGRLVAIEDALEATCGGGDAIYVGRCTSDGCRDFYFYTVEGLAWQDVIGACMSAYPEYRFDLGRREDPSWSSYCTFLYPTEVDRQGIENRRVCEALERNGDELLVAREIDHWAGFSEKNGRDEFVERAVSLGFSVRGISAGEQDGAYWAQLWRSDIPSMSGIDDVTLPLFKLALDCGGSYDGWESVVVQSDLGTQER